jgi:membrane fusion protein (multidrug efflux system)
MAEVGPISAFLSFNSTLETEAVVDLFPRIAGQVEVLHVEEGQVVKEGDPLLKIEDRELRVDVAENAASFEHLQQGFSRLEDLFSRNLINKQEFEDKRFQLEQARLRVERARIRLSYATVRAPFSGVITAREVQFGSRVGTGTMLFSLVKLDEIVARVFVPGQYLAVVTENQAAQVLSDFLPGRTFRGWVKRISPIVDPRSGTFKVTVGVEGEPGELAPGVFVNVQIVTDTRPEAILLPKAAVVYEGGERYAFAVVNGRAERRRLVAGFESAEKVEVLSGFEPGTLVIVLGQSGLKDGSAVRIVNPSPPQGAVPPAAQLDRERTTGRPGSSATGSGG